MEASCYGKLKSNSGYVRWVRNESFGFDLIKDTDGIAEITPVDGFIKGKTLDGRNIHILCKNPITIFNRLIHITTDAYIIGTNQDMGRSCSGIRFYGGILSKLFTPKKIKIINRDKEKTMEYVDDTVSKSGVVDNRKISIRISSTLLEKTGQSGTSIENQLVVLELLSPNGFKLTDIIPMYNAVVYLCQFLTFRKNIGFEKVELIRKGNSSKYHVPYAFAEVYVETGFKEMTKKPYSGCLSFNDLGNGLMDLFRNVYEIKDKKLYMQLDFFPEDDNDYNWLTPDKIKKICTCLECEADVEGVTIKNDPQFHTLIQKIKQLISESEKGCNPFPKGTYGLMRGSIEHWDCSAKDKVKMLYEKNKDLLERIDAFRYSKEQFEKAISEFINFRNTTTHGNYMRVTGEHADTAANLMNLIYIIRLRRYGVPDEVILERLQYGLAYSHL